MPWPVYVETHLVLGSRGHAAAALAVGRSLLEGVHALRAPTDAEHVHSLDLLERFSGVGVDLADAVVMAMAASRRALILTWDFRHFRATAPERRRPWPLLVQEHEVPRP